jgi:hypothetical protein
MKFSALMKQKTQTAAEPSAPVEGELVKMVQPAPNNPFAALKKTLDKPVVATVPAPITEKNPSIEEVANMELNVGPELGSFPTQPEAVGSDATAQLQAMIASLETHMGKAELETQLTTTLQFLDSHAELQAILKPEDIHIFVNAMRSTYGTVIAKKQSRSRSSAATNAKVEEAAADLAALDF